MGRPITDRRTGSQGGFCNSLSEAQQRLDEAIAMDANRMDVVRVAQSEDLWAQSYGRDVEDELVRKQLAEHRDDKPPSRRKAVVAHLPAASARVLGLALVVGGFALGVGPADLLIECLAVVIALALAVLCVAQATPDTRFFWTGIAVFLSGLLFASALTFLRTSESPKGQPVVILVRGSQSPGSLPECRTVDGVFVAQTGSETDGRVYYGPAAGPAQEPDLNQKTYPNLTSVARKDVIAVNLGRLVAVEDIGKGFEGLGAELKQDFETEVCAA